MTSETSKTNEDGDVTNACTWKCLKCGKVNSKAVRRCRKPCYSYPGGRRGPNKKKKENSISSPSSKQESLAENTKSASSLPVAKMQSSMAESDPKQTELERMSSKGDPVPSGPNKRNREESIGSRSSKIAASTANTDSGSFVTGAATQSSMAESEPKRMESERSSSKGVSVPGEEVQVASIRILVPGVLQHSGVQNENCTPRRKGSTTALDEDFNSAKECLSNEPSPVHPVIPKLTTKHISGPVIMNAGIA